MLFKKVVNPEVNLVKHDIDHLFSKSDFPKFGEKSRLFEARNCYIRIAYVDNDIKRFIIDKNTINRLKNKDVYFVEFGSNVEELSDKHGTIVLDDIFENFIDEMDEVIKYLNDYLIIEYLNNI